MLLLPFVIYGGFGRLAFTSSTNKSLPFISLIAELIFHTIPFGLLMLYNYHNVEKHATLDYALITLLGLGFLQIVIELIAVQMKRMKGNEVTLIRPKYRIEDL